MGIYGYLHRIWRWIFYFRFLVDLFFIYYYLEVMVNSFIKLKIFKFTMIGAIAGGIAAVAVASIVAKEMCKKKKKTPEEKIS